MTRGSGELWTYVSGFRSCLLQLWSWQLRLRQMPFWRHGMALPWLTCFVPSARSRSSTVSAGDETTLLLETRSSCVWRECGVAVVHSGEYAGVGGRVLHGVEGNSLWGLSLQGLMQCVSASMAACDMSVCVHALHATLHSPTHHHCDSQSGVCVCVCGMWE